MATPRPAPPEPAASAGEPPGGTGAAKVNAPEASVTLAAVQVEGGPLPNAERSLAALREGFLDCYQQGLKDDPAQDGVIAFSAEITETGAPGLVSAETTGNVSLSVLTCARAQLSAAKFEAPTGSGGARLSFEATFATRR